MYGVRYIGYRSTLGGKQKFGRDAKSTKKLCTPNHFYSAFVITTTCDQSHHKREKKEEEVMIELQLSQLRLVCFPLRGHGALHLFTSPGSCLSYLSAINQICFPNFLKLHTRTKWQHKTWKLRDWFCFKNQIGYVWYSTNSHGSLMCMCETFTSMTFAGDEGFLVAGTVVTLYVERDCVPNLR